MQSSTNSVSDNIAKQASGITENEQQVVFPMFSDYKESMALKSIKPLVKSENGKEVVHVAMIEFTKWCKIKEESDIEWTALEKFLHSHYGGVANTLDAYFKWFEIPPPTSKGQLDEYFEKYKSMAKLAGVDIEGQQFAMEFLRRLPIEIARQLIATPNIEKNLTVEQVLIEARLFFSTKEFGKSKDAMDIDQVKVGNSRYYQKGRPRPPPFEKFSQSITREEYDRRLNEKLCCGCGGAGHFWNNCSNYPKGHRM
ncbi:hypothetical protein H4219_006420 [Mycoemilia scoparia]|uniref:Uncharacterized protein n=1 Tax=Mycoemilia scoparia TaxID=417184 RepID=A0A9W7ZQX5_9FUNG|nr:hypothetical protein H4219_006420 [Mycoemilia scoparia]